MLSDFRYIAPKSRTELFAHLSDKQKESRILAGGTDLLVNIRNGLMSPEWIVDLKRIDGYSGITWSEKEGLVRTAVTILPPTRYVTGLRL
jgi:carbon-monoxide dehydrogenase medium subunit